MDRELLREYLRCMLLAENLSPIDAERVSTLFMGVDEKTQYLVIESWRKDRAEALRAQLETLRSQTDQTESLLKRIT